MSGIQKWWREKPVMTLTDEVYFHFLAQFAILFHKIFLNKVRREHEAVSPTVVEERHVASAAANRL